MRTFEIAGGSAPQRRRCQSFKNLLMTKELLVDRFPVPRYVVTQHGESQARFLPSKLNPSTTHASGVGFGHPGAQAIFTDDVNLQNFFEHLKKYDCMEFLADYRLALTGAS